MLAVCHVLRYYPPNRKIKALIDSGAIGDLVNIQHIEPVSLSTHVGSCSEKYHILLLFLDWILAFRSFVCAWQLAQHRSKQFFFDG